MVEYRIGKSNPPHPADDMTATVTLGDNSAMSIINPKSFAEGGAEWVIRYGNPESIRYTIASLLSSYDSLMSGDISMKEATRRLRLARAARRAISVAPKEPKDGE